MSLPKNKEFLDRPTTQKGIEGIFYDGDRVDLFRPEESPSFFEGGEDIVDKYRDLASESAITSEVANQGISIDDLREHGDQKIERTPEEIALLLGEIGRHLIELRVGRTK